MLSDFEMISHHFPSNNDVKIYPISDVHLGAAEHMQAEWERFLAKLLEDHNAKVILCGDLVNNALKTSVSNIYEETMRPREQKKMMVDMLYPIRDKILCAVTGNHERRSLKDSDSDITYDIMCKLDLEHLYRENVAFVRMKIGKKGTNGQCNPSYCLAVTHGTGGGVLTGGNVNRNERFGYVLDGVDALVVGHSHKPWVTQPSKIKVDTHNDKVSIVPFKVISASSWLNYGGYAAQKMLLPSSHASQIITLKGRRKEVRVEM